MREDLEQDLQALVDRLDAAAGRISRPYSPISPLIVEGARSALRPRGVSAPCPPVSGVCPAVRDLPVVRSRTRVLFASLPRGGSSRVGLRGTPAPSTESGRPARSSRPSARVPRAPARDGSGFPPRASIRHTRAGVTGERASEATALHRLWPVACGAAHNGAPGPVRLAPLIGSPPTRAPPPSRRHGA